MKTTTEQYAKLLYEALKTLDEEERKALIKGVADLIKTNCDVAKLSEIESKYQSIKKKESGELEGTIYTAKKINEKQIDKIQKAVAIRKNIPSKLIVLKNEIDLKMRGGFIVKFENEILDGSLDSKIVRVKKALVS